MPPQKFSREVSLIGIWAVPVRLSVPSDTSVQFDSKRIFDPASKQSDLLFGTKKFSLHKCVPAGTIKVLFFSNTNGGGL